MCLPYVFEFFALSGGQDRQHLLTSRTCEHLQFCFACIRGQDSIGFNRLSLLVRALIEWTELRFLCVGEAKLVGYLPQFTTALRMGGTRRELGGGRRDGNRNGQTQCGQGGQ